jgi:hypothetical protein
MCSHDGLANRHNHSRIIGLLGDLIFRLDKGHCCPHSIGSLRLWTIQADAAQSSESSPLASRYPRCNALKVTVTADKNGTLSFANVRNNLIWSIRGEDVSEEDHFMTMLLKHQRD